MINLKLETSEYESILGEANSSSKFVIDWLLIRVINHIVREQNKTVSDHEWNVWQDDEGILINEIGTKSVLRFRWKARDKEDSLRLCEDCEAAFSPVEHCVNYCDACLNNTYGVVYDCDCLHCEQICQTCKGEGCKNCLGITTPEV